MKARLFFVVIYAFLLISCENKKEIQLPKASKSIVNSIGAYSSVYIFYKVKEGERIAELNRANTISATHWVFNIDKRLPLRLVIPEIIKMQAKKEESMHKNEASENYFSYADTVHKSLAFFPFTKILYHLNQPSLGRTIFFDKSGIIWMDGVAMNKSALKQIFNKMRYDNATIFNFCFSSECTFENYLQNEIFIKSIRLPSTIATSNRQVYVY